MYWDGQQWTDQFQPQPPRHCLYCMSEIHPQSTRCPHCAGEFRFCPTCQQIVGLNSRQKFVGWVRGGMKTQYRWQQCNLVLHGPRW